MKQIIEYNRLSAKHIGGLKFWRHVEVSHTTEILNEMNKFLEVCNKLRICAGSIREENWKAEQYFHSRDKWQPMRFDRSKRDGIDITYHMCFIRSAQLGLPSSQ
jgi:hypothetical protein